MEPATEFGAETILPLEDALLTDTVLGAGLPEDAERHLRLASLCYHDADPSDKVGAKVLRDVLDRMGQDDG